MLDTILEKICEIFVNSSSPALTKAIERSNEILLGKKRQKLLNVAVSEQFDASIEKLTLMPGEVLKANCAISKDNTLNSLNAHLTRVKKWSETVNFLDLSGPISLKRIHISLDTYLTPKKLHVDISESSNKRPLIETIFSNNCHAVVLGSPGAGKTTSMQKICSTLIESKLNYSIPILIRLRDLNKYDEKYSIFTPLVDLFSFDIEFSNALTEASTKTLEMTLKKEIVLHVLEKIKPVIIFDGFDEISSFDNKSTAAKELRQLCDNMVNTKIIVTSRTNEFNYSFGNTNVFEISPLSDKQIYEFLSKWTDDEIEAKNLYLQISNSPFFDTAIKPLTLAHLCAIYQRTRKIPDKPKTVYNKVIRLLIDEWDEQRSVTRNSIFKNFSADRKFDFLSNLAFTLTANYGASVFNSKLIEEVYCQIYDNFSLPPDAAKSVVLELEAHTGIFFESGYMQYEFIHKSLQEYLAAEYLVRLPSIDMVGDKRALENLSSELAIAVAISSNPSIFLAELILRVFKNIPVSEKFFEAFVGRLVQEKPDFNQCDELVLSAFHLINKHEDQSCTKLFKLMTKNASNELINKYYSLSNKNTAQSYLYLQKHSSHRYYILEHTLRIPVKLLLRTQE